jgi:NhaP-type Na+/H+ or K+/H+ antiporter
MIVTELLPVFGSMVFIFATLSLTIVRMLPVAIAMIGTGLKTLSLLFLGWFGPRGLASVVLGMIFLERNTTLSYEATIIQAVAATVLLSISAHGLSALSGMMWYAKQIEGLDESAPELEDSISVLSGCVKPSKTAIWRKIWKT